MSSATSSSSASTSSSSTTAPTSFSSVTSTTSSSSSITSTTFTVASISATPSSPSARPACQFVRFRCTVSGGAISSGGSSEVIAVARCELRSTLHAPATGSPPPWTWRLEAVSTCLWISPSSYVTSWYAFPCLRFGGSYFVTSPLNQSPGLGCCQKTSTRLPSSAASSTSTITSSCS